LPATIRSRCQQLVFQPAPADVGREWLIKQLPEAGNPDVLLQLAANAPLTALRFNNAGLLKIRKTLLEGFEQVIACGGNPSAISEQWLKLGLNESLYCLYSWTVDMIRLALSGESARLANPDIRKRLSRLAALSDKRRLFRRLDKTGELLNRLDQTLNPQLMLEDLLIDWSMK